MNFFSKIFARIKTRKEGGTKILSSNLDQMLVKKTRDKLIPGWSQFKYLGQFLSKKERIAIFSSLGIAMIAFLSWMGIFIYKHNAVSPAFGGEYSEGLVGQPQFVNPIFSSTNAVDSDLVSLIYSGLFKYDSNRKLIPDLASNYSISEDNKTYDISLRSDVKWSDGEPFTADDVIFTFDTILDPEVGSPLFVGFQGVQVEKIDDYNVRFILKDPFAPFLSSLTVGIIPRHVWSDIPPSGMRMAKTNIQPVGTGKWKFGKLTKDSYGNIQSYELERNENFYDQFPFIKTLVFKFYTDYMQAAVALKSHDVFALSFLPVDLVNRFSNKNYNIFNLKLPQYTAIFFNQNQLADLKDSDLRFALTHAIDKNKIITQGLDGRAAVINSPTLDINNDKISYPDFNPDKAIELIDKKWEKIEPEEYYDTQYKQILKTKEEEINAIKNSSSTPDEIANNIKTIENEVADQVRQSMDQAQPFYWKSKDGKILSITISTVDSIEYDKVATLIAEMWKKVGVQVLFQTVASSQLSRDVLKTRDYQVLIYGEIVGSDPDPFPFWHSSQASYPGLNLSQFTDRNADKLLEDARLTTDPAKRDEMYKQFAEIIAKEMPAIFLYTPTYNMVVAKEIKGIGIGDTIFSPSDRYSDISNWYTKTQRQWKD